MRHTLSKPVTDRIKAGKCLHCDSAAGRRGLCVKHYLQFRRELLSQPNKARAKFELEAIKDGKVLAVGAVQQVKSDNPFRKVI